MAVPNCDQNETKPGSNEVPQGFSLSQRELRKVLRRMVQRHIERHGVTPLSTPLWGLKSPDRKVVRVRFPPSAPAADLTPRQGRARLSFIPQSRVDDRVPGRASACW